MDRPLRLRPHWSHLIWWSVWATYVLIAIGAVLAWLAGPISVAIVTVILVVDVARRYRSAGIRLDESGVHWRGVHRCETIAWTSLDGIWLKRVVTTGHAPGGLLIEAATPRASGPVEPVGVFAPESAESQIRIWMSRNQPGIVVDPPPWWRDRHGHWHAEDPDADPHETMQTIRRAEVGPYLVRLAGPNESCSVVSVDRRARERPRNESGPHPTVRDAITAAHGVIDRLRVEIDAEPISSTRADLVNRSGDHQS